MVVRVIHDCKQLVVIDFYFSCALAVLRQDKNFEGNIKSSDMEAVNISRYLHQLIKAWVAIHTK